MKIIEEEDCLIDFRMGNGFLGSEEIIQGKIWFSKVEIFVY